MILGDSLQVMASLAERELAPFAPTQQGGTPCLQGALASGRLYRWHL